MVWVDDGNQTALLPLILPVHVFVTWRCNVMGFATPPYNAIMCWVKSMPNKQPDTDETMGAGTTLTYLYWKQWGDGMEIRNEPRNCRTVQLFRVLCDLLIEQGSGGASFIANNNTSLAKKEFRVCETAQLFPRTCSCNTLSFLSHQNTNTSISLHKTMFYWPQGAK